MSNNKKLLVITKNGKLALSKIDGSLLTDFEYDNEFAISREGYTIVSDSVTNVKTADFYYFKELDEGGVGNV